MAVTDDDPRVRPLVPRWPRLERLDRSGFRTVYDRESDTLLVHLRTPPRPVTVGKVCVRWERGGAPGTWGDLVTAYPTSALKAGEEPRWP